MSVFKRELHLTGSDSAHQAQTRWKARNTSPTVGKPHFVRTADDRQSLLLYYHNSFKKDMCDTMFTGDIQPNDEGCQLHGYVTVTPRMRLFAWILLAVSILAGFGLLLFLGDGLRISVIVWGVGIALFIFSHQVTKQRADSIEAYLQTFINQPDENEDEDEETEAE
jgi:hypothetical protein